MWKQKIKASQYWTLVYASKTITVYGGAYETITIDGYSGSFTTNADGSVSHVVPIDTITLTGSVSGQSFTRTVTSDTTDVYAMPEGALYWYGNKCGLTYESVGTTTVYQTNKCIVTGNSSSYGELYFTKNIDSVKYKFVSATAKTLNEWCGIYTNPEAFKDNSFGITSNIQTGTCSTSTAYYVQISGGYNFSAEVYAIWLE